MTEKLTQTSANDASLTYGSVEGNMKICMFDKIIDKMVRVECVWCEELVGMVKVETKDEEDNPKYVIIPLCKKCVNSYESSVKKSKPRDLVDKEELI